MTDQFESKNPAEQTGGLRNDVVQDSSIISSAPEPEARFTVRYRLSMEDYTEFNMLLYAVSMKKQRTKMRIFGIAEIVIAAIMFVFWFMGESTPMITKVMTVVLFLFGVFSLTYYAVLFPRQLTKTVHKAYESSESLKNEFCIRLYDSFVRDTYDGKQTDVPYEDVLYFLENEKFLLIMLSQMQAFILPKQSMDEETYLQLSDFLNEKCDEYGLRRRRTV